MPAIAAVYENDMMWYYSMPNATDDAVQASIDAVQNNLSDVAGPAKRASAATLPWVHNTETSEAWEDIELSRYTGRMNKEMAREVFHSAGVPTFEASQGVVKC